MEFWANVKNTIVTISIHTTSISKVGCQTPVNNALVIATEWVSGRNQASVCAHCGIPAMGKKTSLNIDIGAKNREKK